MASLLDFGLPDPRTQGLLAAGFKGLQMSGPSLMPTSFGQILGGAGQAGLGAWSQAADSARKAAQTEALIELERQKTSLTKAQVDAAVRNQQIQNELLTRFGLLGGALPEQPAGSGETAPGMSATTSASLFGTPEFATPAPQQKQGGLTGRFPLDLNQVTAMRLAGMPDLLPNYKEGQPNVSVKDGFLVDPRFGVVGSVPQTNQQGFSTMTVRDPSAPGGFRVVPVAGGNEAFTQQRLIQEGAQAAFGSPITIPATGSNASPTMTTPYNFAVGQGAPDILARGGTGLGGGVPAGLSPAEVAAQAAREAEARKVAENNAKIYNDLQNASMSNGAKISKFRRIGDLLGDFEGGKFSKTGLDLASAANSAGIKIDGKLANKEAAEALTNEVALELRSTADGQGMPGAMSDPDREFLRAMTPQMSQTAEGRRLIIDSHVKVLERQNQVASMARQYRQRHGQLNENFFQQLQDWSNRNRLFQ